MLTQAKQMGVAGGKGKVICQEKRKEIFQIYKTKANLRGIRSLGASLDPIGATSWAPATNKLVAGDLHLDYAYDAKRRLSDLLYKT